MIVLPTPGLRLVVLLRSRKPSGRSATRRSDPCHGFLCSRSVRSFTDVVMDIGGTGIFGSPCLSSATWSAPSLARESTSELPPREPKSAILAPSCPVNTPG